MTRVRTYAAWSASRPQNAAWVDRVTRSFPPYERFRTRDSQEASLLRERGTAANLIGPARG